MSGHIGRYARFFVPIGMVCRSHRNGKYNFVGVVGIRCFLQMTNQKYLEKSLHLCNAKGKQPYS